MALLDLQGMETEAPSDELGLGGSSKCGGGGSGLSLLIC